MAEYGPEVEAFVSDLGFPIRRAETPEVHIGRVADMLVRASPDLRKKMNKILTAVAEGHDRDDPEVFGAIDSAVADIKQSLHENVPVKGLTVKEQAAILLERVAISSKGKMPNVLKCAGLSFPDGNLFDCDTAASAKAIAAISICSTCTKRLECLNTALVRDEEANIWGGIAPPERRRIRAKRYPR